jgi:recombination protein RecT
MMTATATAPAGVALTRSRVAAILLTDEAKQQIMPLLPPGVAIQVVVSEVNRAVVENPELLECTPVSLIMAVSSIVKWDLEIGQTAYLVPFKTKVGDRYEKRAKALRDYKGDIELVVRSGAARKVDAKCVYANESFKYEEGTQPYIEHHPITDPAKRGEMLGAYAYAKLGRYELKIAFMSVSEIDEIRQAKSQSWKAGVLPAWYAKKTVIHQVTKSLPKNPALAEVLRAFEKEEKEEQIPDGEFEVVDEMPVAAESVSVQTPAPTDPATEGQVKRLRELAADSRINDATRTKVTRRLERGIVFALAGTWIEALELELKAKASVDEESDELPLTVAGSR